MYNNNYESNKKLGLNFNFVKKELINNNDNDLLKSDFLIDNNDLNISNRDKDNSDKNKDKNINNKKSNGIKKDKNNSNINKNNIFNNIVPVKEKTDNNIIKKKVINNINIDNNANDENDEDSESFHTANSKEFEERIPEPLPEFENVRKLKKEFNIIDTPGDGNCLFNSLSYIIFNSFGYHSYIRQKICDYLEENNDYDDEAYKNDEKKRIIEMRKDGTYGTDKEIKAFCSIYNIRITLYKRIVQDLENNKKENSDKLINHTFNEIYDEKFALMLSYYGDDSDNNHFEALIYKKGNIIEENKLKKIKENICDIDPNSSKKNEQIRNKEKIVISGKTGKIVQSRKGDSTWNLFMPKSRRENLKNSYNLYLVKKFNKELKEKVEYRTLVKTILLSEIIEAFSSDNIMKNGLNNIINNYKNIVIDKINDKIITNVEMNKVMNINDKRAKQINNCICYECSGLNGNGKKSYRIYNSLFELKDHCVRKHEGILDKCVVNYTLASKHIEIDIKKNGEKYIICDSDLLIEDKKDYDERKGKIQGGNGINAFKKIKIYGENIRTFNEMNRGLLSNVLDNNRPDFVLLNECFIGNASFKMSGYNLELSDKNKVGIIYWNVYYLNKSCVELEDKYNMIRTVNTEKGNLIIYCVYIPPGEKHDIRVKEFIERLLLLKSKYNSLSLILFGDLNIERKNIKRELIDKIELYGFHVWYNNDKNVFTHDQKLGDKKIESYLDYMITYGIDNINFNVGDKLVNTDHKCLELTFIETNNRKLNRIKEIVEPYTRVYTKSEEITNKLIEVFNSDVPEVKLLRLIHDNKYSYKTIKKKFKFRTNLIKEIATKVKELQKKGDFYAISKLIKKHRTEKWELFLKELYNLRVANNVKEYFLRLKFYTYINKNTDILKNLKINKNGNEIITLNKEEINSEVIIKYKNLLGDNGFKNIYYSFNDKVITITEEDIKYAHENVMKDKAVSWDLIPGKSLKKAIKPEYYEKIKNILNRYLIPGVMPEEITTSRLFCLNKNANEAGDVNNLRPIAISSTILKIIESAILTRLLKEVNDKKLINKKQIGFIKGCGTELNLLKLRQRVFDIKKSTRKYTKYLLFIDLKNAYDKVNHIRLFNKLAQLNISKEIIGTIKLLYSKAKLKVSYNSENINVNNGVLQGSLISPILFDLYINDLINELDKNSFEVLAYADDLCVLCEGINQLSNVLKIIDNWTKLNGINVNKKKSGIMILKNKIENNDNIDGYPIINKYKYLGIMINDKMTIQSHIGNIDKKLKKYFEKNYILNKRFFSVKSIMLIFGYFHKSRLLYGLPAFIDQKSKIERIDRVMTTNIKKLLKLPISTNTQRLKLALGLPDLNTYLVQRLIKLKIKYENTFNEKLTMYDETIKKILNIDDISKVRISENYLYNKLKDIGLEENIDINKGFITRLKNKLYSWYVDSDFILLKFMSFIINIF